MKAFVYTIIIIVVLITFFAGLIGYATADPYYQSTSQRQSYLILLITGSIGLFILPIIFLIVKTVKDIKKDFESGRSKITFKDWVYNLVPLRPIQVLINQVYPNEKILNKRRISFEGLAGLFRFGKMPVGIGYNIDVPLAAVLYETEDAYYIDRRLQEMLIAPLEIILLYYFILGVRDFSTPSGDIMQLSFTMLFIIFSTYVIIFRCFFQVSRIEVIRKGWLGTRSNEIGSRRTKNTLDLVGTIPKDSQLSLSTDKSVNTGDISIPFARTLHLL